MLYNGPALLYLALNGAASGLALALIRGYGWTFGAAAGSARWTQLLVAGVGAMALFRTSLFTVRAGDRDIAVGPATFLQIFRDAADREVDRLRARDRSSQVGDLMDGVDYEKASEGLIPYSLALMQNVPDDEQQKLVQRRQTAGCRAHRASHQGAHPGPAPDERGWPQCALRRRGRVARATENLVRILGIESSCDETAAAVVEDGDAVLSSVVASQMITHGKYGGVVPELASREHLRAIVPVVREALERSGTRLEDLAAIAATVGPGLVGSLLVGLTYAKSLSFASGVPLIAVNHIEGHIHAVVLEARRAGTPVEFPAVALVVSGGHTHLFEVREGFEYRLLGKTRDDAAGEAFDKVAKLLGYCYPGGPVVDQLSPLGDAAAVRFTFAKMKGNALDFSFSGLKTAVLRWVESHDMQAEIAARRALLRENPSPRRGAMAGRHPATHAGPAGFVPARRDRGAADARRRRRRKHRGALAHRLRRRGLQLGPARRGQGGRPAVPGLFPFRRPLHRQRRHDRRRRFPQAGAGRFRVARHCRASQPHAGVSVTEPPAAWRSAPCGPPYGR